MMRTAILPALTRLERISLSGWSVRVRVILQIARREIRDALFGWAFYLTGAIALAGGVVLTYNSLRFVGESGLQIIGRPFFYPVLIAATLAALYLAGWATVSIARARDQGALRVLFFAPIDGSSLLAGHWLAGVGIYTLLLLVTAPSLVLLSFLTNLPLPTQLLVGLLFSPALIAPAIAAGLFVSAIARSSRGALFLFLGVLLLIGAIEVGHAALLNVPMTSRYYDALSFLRELLRVTQNLLEWVSPFSLLSNGLDASLRSSWSSLSLYAAGGLIGSAGWLALGSWAIRKRGVLP